jgi:hypothetical protein
MSAEGWVIVVGLPPSEPESREMLELVLAGATLDVELVVVFDGAGCGHLEPDAFAPWRQLVDFDLADLRARAPGTELLPGGVTAIEDAAFDDLCRKARGVLRL